MRIAKTLSLPQIDSTTLDQEDIFADSLKPLLKEALFPGTAIRPARNVVVIIEVLEVE